jgi:hypothetical protein
MKMIPALAAGFAMSLAVTTSAWFQATPVTSDSEFRRFLPRRAAHGGRAL